MRLKEIIERFTLVSGFEMKDVSRYLPIIADCKAFFEARAGEPDASDQRRLEHACAVYAFYRVSRIGGLSEVGSFKVGDVQVDIAAVAEAAQKMWDIERESISDIIDIGSDFGFRSVSV